MFSSADESLKDETRLLLPWDGLLVTLRTFVFVHIASVLKSVRIFTARSRVSKSCLMAELYFYRFVKFGCVLIYIFGFHHKQCASE